MDVSRRTGACADSQRPAPRAAGRSVRAAAALGWLAVASTLFPTTGRAADEAALAKEKKCLNCHALDRKLVGPAFRDVAARDATDHDAPARLAKKIRVGGAGAWGVVPMPSNDVTPDEATRLATWVLQQK